MKRCPTCGENFRPRWGQRFCSLACSRPRGRAHPRYNGGVSFNRRLGRWVIVCRDGSLMYFARGVMAAQLGRLLTPNEIVHHINGDSTDDRPDNLQVVSRSEHMAIHRREIMDARHGR